MKWTFRAGTKQPSIARGGRSLFPGNFHVVHTHRLLDKGCLVGAKKIEMGVSETDDAKKVVDEIVRNVQLLSVLRRGNLESIGKQSLKWWIPQMRCMTRPLNNSCTRFW